MSETSAAERPSIDAPEWNEWVIGQLREDELFDGKPKADGLRRLVEKLIGPIVGIYTQVIQVPDAENLGRATVSANIQIRLKDGDILNYTQSADVHRRNTDLPFANYPVATAETRAMGRAYKLALRLKTCTAEEVSDVAEVEVEEESTDKITSSQIMGLNNLGKKHNVNIFKLINNGPKTYNKLEEVPLSRASKLVKELNDYGRPTDKGGKEVPADLVGYNENWKTQFKG